MYGVKTWYIKQCNQQYTHFKNSKFIVQGAFEFGPRLRPNWATTLTNRLLYCILLFARPVFFFFFSWGSTYSQIRKQYQWYTSQLRLLFEYTVKPLIVNPLIKIGTQHNYAKPSQQRSQQLKWLHSLCVLCWYFHQDTLRLTWSRFVSKRTTIMHLQVCALQQYCAFPTCSMSSLQLKEARIILDYLWCLSSHFSSTGQRTVDFTYSLKGNSLTIKPDTDTQGSKHICTEWNTYYRRITSVRMHCLGIWVWFGASTNIIVCR